MSDLSHFNFTASVKLVLMLLRCCLRLSMPLEMVTQLSPLNVAVGIKFFARR